MLIIFLVVILFALTGFPLTVGITESGRWGLVGKLVFGFVGLSLLTIGIDIGIAEWRERHRLKHYPMSQNTNGDDGTHHKHTPR
jgi:hypothetical protein